MEDRHREFMNKLIGLCREYGVIIESNTTGDLIIVRFNSEDSSNKREVCYYFGDFIDANTKIVGKTNER